MTIIPFVPTTRAVADVPHELTEAELTGALKYVNRACSDRLIAQHVRAFLAACRRTERDGTSA